MSDSQSTRGELMSSWGQFGVDLYYASIRRLNDKRSNIAVSPYSVGMACLMVGLGSQGQTRRQTMQALRCNLQENVEASDDALAKLAAALLAAVPRSPGEEVSTCFDVANRIFCQDGYPFLASYLDRLRQSCSAGVDYVDYAARADDARERMNAWVAEMTQHKVIDLFQQGSVTADTRLVLANAVYFKGLWAEPFDERATRAEPFHVQPGITVEVPTMSLCTSLRNGYFDEGKARTLAIPYVGNSFVMLLLLPDSMEGLGVLEEAVGGRDVARLLREMRQDEVNLQLPKFGMESEVPLAEVLQEMGMVDMFLPEKADLSGMDGRRQLYVSEARHKAVLEVDEKGSEAAAASSVVVAEFAALEDPVQFIADHPFMFAIVHQETGCMLFLGRVIDPSC